MKISVFGSGYVGLVTASCFAQLGNSVICVDIDENRISKMKKGICPIYEPGLSEIMQKNQEKQRLEFTVDAKKAIENSDVIFIAVGTPSNEDGAADLQYVLQVAETIGKHMNEYKVIVNKSTVPVCTEGKVSKMIQSTLDLRKLKYDFDVVSNPEFLKEGTAIDDCMNPDRIVVGSDSLKAKKIMQKLYAPLNQNNDKLIIMDVRSAEMTKYVANAMLATKISFMNEMSQIADKVGADIESIRIGIGSDKRIGYQFINPGCGYGGSCFPKDVKALGVTASQHGVDSNILTAIDIVNDRQKQVLFKKINDFYQGDISNKTFAIWGVSFKPDTDDIREASSRVLIESLWKAGAKVKIYDPEAMDNFANEYGQNDKYISSKSSCEALKNSDALVVVTEWSSFKSPDFEEIKSILKKPVIFDGRNLYNPKLLSNLGIKYMAIGRPDNF